MIRFFLDTEFNDEIGDCRIEPISIALVSENGEREFYAESAAFNLAAAHPWLHANVLPKLGDPAQRLPLDTIRQGLEQYFAGALQAAPHTDKMQIWTKNGALDQAMLGLLFGGLSYFYAFVNTYGIRRTYFNDTDMLRRQLGDNNLPTVPRDDTMRHHALHDARAERLEYIALQQMISAPTRF